MKQTLLLKLIVVVSACVYRSNGFNVRFDNGSEFEGRVEIEYHNGMCLVLADKIVVAIYNGHFIANDTHMCRQLDFESTQESVSSIRRNEAYYGGNNGTIWFTSMSCTGAESALEQRSDDGKWESIKCTFSSNNGDLFTPNNKTQQFCCNIDFRPLYMWLSSEDSKKIIDGDNIYSPLTAEASIKSIRIGLSDLYVNVTVINIINYYNYITKGSPTWVIVTAIAGAVAAVVGLITCLYKGLCIIIPDDLKRKMGCSRSVQGSKSETPYTRLTNMSEGYAVDSADTSSSADGRHHDQGDPKLSNNTGVDDTTTPT